MKTIELINEGFEKWEKERAACRGIVIEENKLLLSYGTATDLWMIPGGGLEDGESESECCVREVAEETGYVVQPEECALEIVDLFGKWKMINRYFPATVIGRSERKLTEQEKKLGMEPRWLPVEEAIAVFSRYAAFAGVNDMRRELYLREYTALRELFKERQLTDA